MNVNFVGNNGWRAPSLFTIYLHLTSILERKFNLDRHKGGSWQCGGKPLSFQYSEKGVKILIINQNKYI